MDHALLILDADAQAYADALSASGLQARVLPATDMAAACRIGGDADILASLAPRVTQELIDAMPRLRWIAALTTGTDTLDTLRLPADVIVTSARGVHGPQMSEVAILHMLALSRDFGAMVENQAQARWDRWPQKLLHGKTAVIVGVGSISEALAMRCKAFDMRVVGVSDSRTQAPGFDVISRRENLHQAASEADFLIVLAPLTAATRHMIDAGVLRAMPRHAYLVNIARGAVVDEAALVEALRDGRIAGAGLDVFDREPLAADSPLWRMRNVVITPHVGGLSDVYARQVSPLLVENLRCYLAGQVRAMRNLVELAR